MLTTIDLRIAQRLKDDVTFRREWFRAELEQGVPEKVRELREYRKLTQTELAERAEMKQSAVSRFESSTDANWKLDTLLRIAEALDAQLLITFRLAEEVIAQYAQEEAAAERVRGTSVLKAHWESDVFVPRGPSAIDAASDMQPAKRIIEPASVLS